MRASHAHSLIGKLTPFKSDIVNHFYVVWVSKGKIPWIFVVWGENLWKQCIK